MALTVLVALAVAVSGAGVASVVAQDSPPQPPASYYGDVTVSDGDDPAGVTIEAFVNDEKRGSVVVNADGSYGGSGPGDEKLHVRCGECSGDETVSFEIRGESAVETATFQSGQVMNQDLTFDTVPALETPTSTATPEPTPTATPTPEPTEAPGGGSGGGGTGGGTGGGAVTPAPPSTPGPVTPSPPAVVNVTDDDPGSPGVSVNVSQVSQAVESITFTNESAGASVTIVDNPQSPDEASVDVSGDVGQDVRVVSTVEVTPSGSSDVAANLTFRVPTGDVGGPDLVTVFHKRSAATPWQSVATEYDGERNGQYVFTASVESFSTFAVGQVQPSGTPQTATDSVTATATPDDRTPTQATGITIVTPDETHTLRTPTPGQDGPGFGVAVAIVALIAAALLALRRA